MSVSRAVTIRFAFGKDHLVLRVDNGSQGRCGEVDEEAVAAVQARGEGGRDGVAGMERSR